MKKKKISKHNKYMQKVPFCRTKVQLKKNLKVSMPLLMDIKKLIYLMIKRNQVLLLKNGKTLKVHLENTALI